MEFINEVNEGRNFPGTGQWLLRCDDLVSLLSMAELPLTVVEKYYAGSKKMQNGTNVQKLTSLQEYRCKIHTISEKSGRP